MADNIPFGSSGGGAFVPYTPITAINVPSGSSGDIIDVTPAPGNTLRITRLSTGTAVQETGMTVTITNNDGTVDMITNASLDEIQPTSAFYVGRYTIGSLNTATSGLEFLDCKRVVITKVTGNTSNNIQISYIEGRFE